MRTGCPKQPITLPPEDKQKLELLARRPKTAQRAALRAKIALHAAEGLSNQEIAKRLRVTGAERWFAEITEKRIRRGSFKNVKSLEAAIRAYLEHNNENPKPFVWVADADLILGKIERLCERISNSQKTSSTNV